MVSLTKEDAQKCNKKVGQDPAALTLPMLRLHSSNAQERKYFENHLNPVMLVFIGQLSLSTIK